MTNIESIKTYSQPVFTAEQKNKSNNFDTKQNVNVSQLERTPDGDELKFQNGKTTKTSNFINNVKNEVKNYIGGLTPKQKQYGVLSLLIPGAGQLLNGEHKKALCFLILDIPLSIIFAKISPIALLFGSPLGIWSALDAMETLEKKENNTKNTQETNFQNAPEQNNVAEAQENNVEEIQEQNNPENTSEDSEENKTETDRQKTDSENNN